MVVFLLNICIMKYDGKKKNMQIIMQIFSRQIIQKYIHTMFCWYDKKKNMYFNKTLYKYIFEYFFCLIFA